ncbi:class E sortase [Fodinicola feengrottensis]|uniref:Class E sortase n=1 Tax=Fodinicola feengrottensis TaxID=435914 RepID=A0ABN2GVK5_9ACTN|nr:class E sortase [Fodinicola feengrottensis]
MTVYRSSAALGGSPYSSHTNQQGGSHAAASASLGTIVRAIIRGFGQTLITLGLVVMLFAGYEVYGKELQVDGNKDTLNSQLNQQWSHQTGAAASTPIPGQGLARIYIPRLQKDWVVVEGVTPHDIRLAPGHYPKSQLPGQVGNFAVAGHRIKAIFYDLDQLKNGDEIVVQTRTDWFIYKVSLTEIVSPHEVSVVDPVPHHPGATPTQKMITLTTCNPKWDNYQRLIIHGVLASTQPTSAGQPPEITGS